MKQTDNPGINYAGNLSTNKDTLTGIRYGVISANEVDFWNEESEMYYGDPTCPDCGSLVGEDDISDYLCPDCDTWFDSDSVYPETPISFYVENDEIVAEQGGDSTDIFVLQSDYYTYAQFCSPCAPGAVHLENPLSIPNDDNKGYCFGHDWFESGRAPYPVYSVATNKLIY